MKLFEKKPPNPTAAIGAVMVVVFLYLIVSVITELPRWVQTFPIAIIGVTTISWLWWCKKYEEWIAEWNSKLESGGEES
jgi:hypothetical protein